MAEEIRQAIKSELNLTASAGVAPNKFIAKIASDENKPDGICVISPDKVESFVSNLPLKKIHETLQSQDDTANKVSTSIKKRSN